MATYTFRFPGRNAGKTVTVFDQTNAQVASGTTDSNAALAVSLPYGDYYAVAPDGQYVRGGVDAPQSVEAAAQSAGPHPAVWTDFTAKADGPLTTADSGQPWRLATNAGANSGLEIIGGYMTNRAATAGASAAGHAMVTTLSAPVRRIGAEFTMTPGTTDGGSAALVLWKETLVYPGPVVDTSVHVTFGVQTWGLLKFEGGVSTTLATGMYKTPLATDGTLYSVEISVTGNTATLLLPDGSLAKVTNAIIATIPQIVPSWETYQLDPSTDSKAKFARVWADTTLGGKTSTYPTTSRVVELASNLDKANLSLMADYPPTAAGNVALAIPAAATEIDTSLRVSFVAPLSGRVRVVMTGQINQTAAGVLQWTLLIPEGSISKTRPVSNSIQEQTFSVDFLITGLTPGNKYSTRWQHRAFSGAGTLRLNEPGGQVAAITVTPLAA